MQVCLGPKRDIVNKCISELYCALHPANMGSSPSSSLPFILVGSLLTSCFSRRENTENNHHNIEETDVISISNILKDSGKRWEKRMV